MGVALSRLWLAMEIRSGIARPPPARGLFFSLSLVCLTLLFPLLMLPRCAANEQSLQ